MNKTESFVKLGINLNEPVLLITAKEALENLSEAIEEYCPNLKIEKMTKEDLEILLNSYARSVINYHPENYHQERGALLKCFEMLKRYGLTDDNYNSIDFC
jgi:hypothetical protein|uniref:Uncharacterized protein n=1 Tax=candidate division WOR-3 bacterium TaxID=2052148 RepID=A0A7C6EG42_UNCW3